MNPVVWWEPWRASREHTFREVRSTGWFGWAFWARVLIVTSLLTSAAIAAILIAYPGTALPWPQIAGVLLTTPPFIFIAGSAQLLIPVRVEVRRDRIMISQGQGSSLLKPERIRRAEISTDDRGDWLEIEYTTTRGTPRNRRVLLSNRVDLATLARLLADLTRPA